MMGAEKGRFLQYGTRNVLNFQLVKGNQVFQIFSANWNLSLHASVEVCESFLVFSPLLFLFICKSKEFEKFQVVHIAIPFLTDEVELEQSCQERRLVWSVKIRRVRLTRCVFRYGPRDGMTYSAVKPID